MPTLVLRSDLRRTVRNVGGRGHAQEAHLADLHAGYSVMGRLATLPSSSGDATREPGVDEAGGAVDEQAEPAEGALAFDSGDQVVGQADDLGGGAEHELARVEDEGVVVVDLEGGRWVGEVLLHVDDRRGVVEEHPEQRSRRRSTDDGWMHDSSRGSITMRPAASSSRIVRSDRIIGRRRYPPGSDVPSTAPIDPVGQRDLDRRPPSLAGRRDQCRGCRRGPRRRPGRSRARARPPRSRARPGSARRSVRRLGPPGRRRDRDRHRAPPRLPGPPPPRAVTVTAESAWVWTRALRTRLARTIWRRRCSSPSTTTPASVEPYRPPRRHRLRVGGGVDREHAEVDGMSFQRAALVEPRPVGGGRRRALHPPRLGLGAPHRLVELREVVERAAAGCSSRSRGSSPPACAVGARRRRRTAGTVPPTPAGRERSLQAGEHRVQRRAELAGLGAGAHRAPVRRGRRHPRWPWRSASST